MKKLLGLFCTVLALSACDLQPKITSIPDSIGEFITNRYPALLADPETQPEIYNSAATDYGVYASPELYGNADVDDYILYSSVDDYTGLNIGGKTATAEKRINGKIDRFKNLTAFVGAFPIEAPQYTIMVVLDEPKGTPESFGLRTAAWNAVPTTGKILNDILPLLFR